MSSRASICLGICLLLLAACIPAFAPGTVTPSVTVTQQLLATPALQATPTIQSRDLVICSGSEPTDLFLYNEPTYIKSAILSAIYDGPVDMVDYSYQPVILQKLPSLADGDAVIEPVAVQEGDRVMDDSGTLVHLVTGAIVRPAGCQSSGCAIQFQGGSLEMDRLRVRFNLKPGIEWADGAPLTASDSVFSYRVALSQDVLYGYAGLVSQSALTFTFTSEYSALDSNTVEWTGLPGFLDPNYPLAFFSPLPEHQLGSYDIPGLLEANEVLFSPLGWGAFRVAGWEPGVQMTLERNPNYFRSGEGWPFFDRILVRFKGQDREANMAALADGQCDLLLQDAIPGTPNAAMLALIRDGAARLYLDPQPTFEHLVFNLSPADPFAPAFFSDPAVRKAAALCVDRGAIVQAVYNGLVPPLDQSLPEDHPLLLGAPSGMYPFDPRTGAMLLEGLGWIDGNGDGVREAQAVPGFTDGQPLSITLAIPDSTLRVDSGELISGQLRACGFQVNLVQAPGRDLLAQSQEALIAGRRFDLAEMSSALGVEALCALGGSTEIAGPTNSWSGRNLSGYSDPAFDASCRALDNSLPGTPEYITIRQTVIFLFYRAIPDLPLFVRTNFTLARPDLAGISSGLGQNELQQIEEFRWEP